MDFGNKPNRTPGPRLTISVQAAIENHISLLQPAHAASALTFSTTGGDNCNGSSDSRKRSRNRKIPVSAIPAMANCAPEPISQMLNRLQALAAPGIRELKTDWCGVLIYASIAAIPVTPKSEGSITKNATCNAARSRDQKLNK